MRRALDIIVVSVLVASAVAFARPALPAEEAPKGAAYVLVPAEIWAQLIDLAERQARELERMRSTKRLVCL